VSNLSFVLCEIGEFSRTALPVEGNPLQVLVASPASVQNGAGVFEGVSKGLALLGSSSSVFTFTKAFNHLAKYLMALHRKQGDQNNGDGENAMSRTITLDGGPHTLWWYVFF
jgi:hypothetical protein